MSTNVIKQTLLGEPGSQTIKMVVRSNERGPKGEKGDPGPQGPQGLPGERGADGAIHYRAGTGINISAENIITATGGATAEWGGIQGDIADQTDLQNALNAKQDVLADFVGTNGIIAGKRGVVPAPSIASEYSVLMGSGVWKRLYVLQVKQDGTILANYNPGMSYASINIVSPVKIGSTSGNIAQLTDGANNNIYPNIVSGSIPNNAVTASQIDFSTMPGSYSATEINTGYTWVDGTTIYKKSIYIDSLANASRKAVAVGISNLSRVIDMQGIYYESIPGTSETFVPLNMPIKPGDAQGAIRTVIVNGEILIDTDVDRTGFSGYVTLYYTKTS